MAKLTDLPNEVLSLIFREFLSKTLTDHEYLCKWVVEDDAVPKRASLYRLSMVCRIFAKIALPLLYEQLFRYEDISRCRVSNASFERVTEYLGQTCYLHVRINTSSEDTSLDQSFSKMLSSFVHCSRLQHLNLSILHLNSKSLSFLRSLGNTPASHRLKSLSLSVTLPNHHPTMLRDLCAFTNLTGLSIYMDEEGQFDGRYLPCLGNLKELSINQSISVDDVVAFMSLADPRTLRRLSLTLAEENDANALSRILGDHHWTSLEYISYLDGTGSGYGSLIPQDGRLPALRHLRLDFYYQAFSKATFSRLPAGLHSFHVENFTYGELFDALTLIKDGSWLVSRIKTIRFDIAVDPNMSWRHIWPRPKDTILALASEAIMAAQAKDVEIEPVDLIERLREM